MCPGMRPATGWIAYVTSTPLLLEQVGELAHVVLRLRDGQAVAGHEDDLVRVGEHHGDVLGGRGAHRAAVGPRGGRGRRLASTWPNAPKRTFAIERFIARPIIIVSSVPEAPTSMPADDQDVVLELEAGRRGGEAGERVQQRDHDRHVGAADREHEEHAEERARRRRAPRAATRSWTPLTSATPEPAATSKTTPFTNCWPGYVIGRPPISSCSFANATIEPENEIAPISAESTIASEMSTFERARLGQRFGGTPRARSARPRRRRRR